MSTTSSRSVSSSTFHGRGLVGKPPFQSRKFLRDSSVAAVAYIEV
jgi:hypothetical protein